MRALLARILNPIVWAIPGHGARKLFQFALAEDGSMIDLKAAANLSPCPKRRAAYIHHLLDEARHCQMFTLRSAELRTKEGKQPWGIARADTENLFENLGEIRFLAFVHRGESKGRQQFETYRDWFGQRGDEKSRAMFEAILKDERQHERYTLDLLIELTGSKDAARKELQRAMLWEAWRTWRRAGRFMAEKLYFILMVAVYIVMAPWSLVVRAARPTHRGWIR